MHSSRMRTTRSISCVLGGSASVHAGIPPGCVPGDPRRCGPGDPLPSVGLQTPQMWACRPPRCGPGDPPWVWAWRPPRPDHSTSTLGVGLETPQARPLSFPPGCGPEDPPQLPPWVWAWRPAMHAGIPHTPCEQNDRHV